MLLLDLFSGRFTTIGACSSFQTRLMTRSRIALRAPFLRDPLLRHSSLAICARSALAIVQFHRHVISAALLNLPWMQIRRMAISVYIIFIAFWRGEITRAECEQAIDSSLEVLDVLGTRWRSAGIVQETAMRLADVSGRPPGHFFVYLS